MTDLEAALGSFTNCSRLDWVISCTPFDQRENLINQSRSQQSCKLKEQASKIKQIERDSSKQKLIYEKRQERQEDGQLETSRIFIVNAFSSLRWTKFDTKDTSNNLEKQSNERAFAKLVWDNKTSRDVDLNCS